jgi:hypothetical protein
MKYNFKCTLKKKYVQNVKMGDEWNCTKETVNRTPKRQQKDVIGFIV